MESDRMNDVVEALASVVAAIMASSHAEGLVDPKLCEHRFSIAVKDGKRVCVACREVFDSEQRATIFVASNKSEVA